jgi:transcriptional regulator with XRE-family HTH domain
MTMPAKLETGKLADMIKQKRGTRGLREAATEISKSIGEISASTLSRIEQGNLPDIETYITLCQWLEVSTNYFTENHSMKNSTSKTIVAHLRADKNLPKDTAMALVKMITLAYESLEKELNSKDAKK